MLKVNYPCNIRETVESALLCSEQQFLDLWKQAHDLTAEHFGTHRTLFNPIYVSDVCVEDCSYCGFRHSASGKRRTLTPAQAAEEAKTLEHRGVKNILILAGQYSPQQYVRMLANNISAIEQATADWIGIEVAPLDFDGYAEMLACGVDCVVLFQETYDRDRYKEIHKSCSAKFDYDLRYNAPFTACRAGFSEVGLGVLYGVGDWFSDTIAMAEHAVNLLEYKPDLKLRFSFPRLMPSSNQQPNVRSENVTENMLLRAIVAIRLSFPNASLVLTGRESTDFLIKCLSIANVVGKGGSTSVGGYKVYKEKPQAEQFDLNDDISFRQFRDKLVTLGYLC